MKLPFQKRSASKKSEAKQLRREGQIPAVIYGKGDPCQHVAIDAAAFQTILRTVPRGRLATTRLMLVDEKGASYEAIVKDIQYHPTTYNVVHLDFELLHPEVPVNVNVSIEPIGVMDCVGMKLGGVLRQVIRTLRIRCLPKDLPEVFQLNVKELSMRQSLKLSDLSLPSDVRPLEDLHRVAVTIVRR